MSGAKNIFRRGGTLIGHGGNERKRVYFLFLSSFLINSERSVEFEENGDEKKNHACVNGVRAAQPATAPRRYCTTRCVAHQGVAIKNCTPTSEFGSCHPGTRVSSPRAVFPTTFCSPLGRSAVILGTSATSARRRCVGATRRRVV